MRISCIILAAASLLLATLVWGADFQKGLDAYSSADYETALAEWQPLAEAGDIGSQFGLGQMYGNGFGVTMDDAAAIKWYGLAAGQGHAAAQCNLAVMHQNGWGLPQNDVEAMRLFGLAADQGVTEAMIALDDSRRGILAKTTIRFRPTSGSASRFCWRTSTPAPSAMRFPTK